MPIYHSPSRSYRTRFKKGGRYSFSKLGSTVRRGKTLPSIFVGLVYVSFLIGVCIHSNYTCLSCILPQVAGVSAHLDGRRPSSIARGHQAARHVVTASQYVEQIITISRKPGKNEHDRHAVHVLRDKVIAHAEKATTIMPCNPHVHYEIAIMYERLARESYDVYGHALGHYVRALMLDPHNIVYQHSLNEYVDNYIDHTYLMATVENVRYNTHICFAHDGRQYIKN